jgi:hypothetical protein
MSTMMSFPAVTVNPRLALSNHCFPAHKRNLYGNHRWGFLVICTLIKSILSSVASRKLCTTCIVCESKKSWSYLLHIHNNFKKLGKAQRYIHKTCRIQNFQDTESLGFTTSCFTYFIKNKVKFHFRRCTAQNRRSEYFKPKLWVKRQIGKSRAWIENKNR